MDKIDVIVGEIESGSFIELDGGRIVATFVFKRPAHVRHSVDESSQDIVDEVAVMIDDYKAEQEVE